jgi:UPF0755 protein
MKKLLVLLACLAIVATVSVRMVLQWWESPSSARSDVTILVGEGSSLGSVAKELSARKLLRWPKMWRLIARLQGLDSQIKRGEYRFTAAETPASLLRALVSGQVVKYKVTLPEGISLYTALGILQAQEPLVKLLDGVDDPRLLSLVQPAASPEGLFFPDTYSYSRTDSDLGILSLAYRRMQEVLDASWQAREPGLPYENAYQALVMASVVEKETGLAAEREQIAGVFVRRMRANMRLETDPTVIYGLGPGFDGNLRKRHLTDRANPYNTYRHKGLPPTPIALPGRAAIEAALHPAPGTALYFVARGDGSHQFSNTLAEHRQAVQTYQLARRKNYRSAPPEKTTKGTP